MPSNKVVHVRPADDVAAHSLREGILRIRAELDVSADVDMNVVMTGSGRFIEIQGTGEEATFDDAELDKMLKLARRGIGELVAIQKKSLGTRWPF